MSSFLLLTLLSFFSFIAENELRENLVYLFAGLVTCYILNMQIMLKIVRNPFCIVEDKNKQRSENRVLIIYSSILIVIMIIVNLYLLVLWTYFSYDNAYTCSSVEGITKWQLLYYTVITFTTVGYGDISPAIFESQAVAILICITSVMCLIIFVSSVLSAKDAIFGDNTEIAKMEPKQEIKSKQEIEKN
jgi:voltage-gated potassium channel